MRVLAFDPGFTTGIAVYNESGELELTITVTKEKVLRNGFLNKLVAISTPDKVLIEGLPTQKVNQDIADLFSTLKRWFTVAGYDTEIILPGQWKGMVRRVEIPGNHARDAATMAAWYYRTKGNNERDT
jgi:hypothetical protein